MPHRGHLQPPISRVVKNAPMVMDLFSCPLGSSTKNAAQDMVWNRGCSSRGPVEQMEERGVVIRTIDMPIVRYGEMLLGRSSC